MFSMMLGMADSDVWVDSVKGLDLSSASVETLNGQRWQFWAPAANADGAGGACLVATVGSYQIRVCDPGDTSRNALKSLRPIASELTISDASTPAGWHPRRQALGLDGTVPSITSTAGGTRTSEAGSTQPAASIYGDLPGSFAEVPARLPFLLSRQVGWKLWSGTRTLGDQWPISLGFLHDPDNRLTQDTIGDFHRQVIITVSHTSAADLYARPTAAPVTVYGITWSTVYTQKSGDAPVKCLTTSIGADTLGICYVNATQNEGPDDLWSFANGVTIAGSEDPKVWFTKAAALD